MQSILIVKTAALGDVLRTTSILPGLVAKYPTAEIHWITAPAAVDLVRLHPQVERVLPLDVKDDAAVDALAKELAGRRWDWVLSFDDEMPLCRLVSSLDCARLSGAYLAEDDSTGEPRRYTEDVGPWFDMGLLSVHGKATADRMKVENTRTHPAIFADMLGIEMGQPELPLDDQELSRAQQRMGQFDGLTVGLNTGAGGRWRTKELAPDRTVAFAKALREDVGRPVRFVVLGGAAEADRNAAIVAGLTKALGADSVWDGGTENNLLEFAALVSQVDLMLSSDSLALHMAIARRVPAVVFFAPTSAAEIELYGRGAKVVSTAPDYCSYRPDADNSSITTERLIEAARGVLAAGGRG